MSQTRAQLISDLVQALNFAGTSDAPATGLFCGAADEVALATSSTARLTVDGSGRVLVGHSSSRKVGDRTHLIQIEGNSSDDGGVSMVRNVNDDNATSFTLAKTRGTSVGATTIVQNGDKIGEFAFAAADGSDVITRAALIQAHVDGTPGANDMPGRLVFSTTADAASSPTERMRIQSDGTVKIGTGSGNPILMLNASTSGTSVIQMGDSADNNIGQIQYANSDDSMRFFANNSERLRIDSSGRLLQGLTTAKTGFFNDNNAAPVHQIQGSTYYTTAFSIFRDGSGGSGPNFILAKGREAIVEDGDDLGTISFQGHDGTTELVEGAAIRAEVDGTPGSNDMPGRLVFFTTADGASSGTERVRIDSSGRVGVGTTSPGCQLGGIHAVHDATQGTPTFTGAEVGIFQRNFNGAQDCAVSIVSGNNASSTINFGDTDDVNPGIIEYLNGSNAMRFSTNASEQMRIDSSGRILAGTTASTGNFRVVLQGNAGNSSAGGDILLARGAATPANAQALGLVGFSDNTHTISAQIQCNRDGGTWSSSSKPTLMTFATCADGSDTATERMRIDSSGRLLIAVNNANNAATYADDLIVGTTSGDRGMTIVSQNVNAGSINFSDGTSADEKSRGIIQYDHGGDFIRCYVDSVERFRINNKGFVKAGPRITDGSHGVASQTSARHEFTSDDNGWTIIVTHTSGAASEHEGILIDYNNDPNGTGNSFLQGNANSNTRFRMASNGGLYNYQSNDSNLCDEREKKNIVNLDTKWDKVKSWDLKKFHYNEDADDDDLRYGVIAQQVEQHCPEVLTEWIKQSAEDAVLDEDGNVVTPAVAEVTRKGVKEQQMMWMAIKALQEAQTRIESLETKVAALEAE